MARTETTQLGKFKLLQRRLKEPNPCVLGLLEMLWISAHQAADPIFCEGEVEAVCEWYGEEGILVAALLETKWLDNLGNGSVEIHNYWENCPRYVWDRARKKVERKKRPTKLSTDCADASTDSKEMSHTTQPNPTQPNPTRPEEKKASAKPEADSAAAAEDPTFLHFDCPGNQKTFALKEAKVLEYENAYGEQINVRRELQRAAQWLRDNPTRKKTAKGMPRFLGAWLGRAVDSGRSAGRDRAPREDLSLPGPANPFANGKGVVT